MRLIDAKALARAIQEATIYKSPIPGNWWHGNPKKLDQGEILKIIREQPTYMPLTEGGLT